MGSIGDQLRELYADNRELAENKLSKQGDCKSLSDLYNSAKGTFFSLPAYSFMADTDKSLVGSWVEGKPLMAQLQWQPKLIVDLTLSGLKNPQKEYGMTIDALNYLAENKYIMLNFRDYESLLKTNFKEIEASSTAKKNLQIFLNKKNDKHYTGLHITGALREAIFRKASKKQSLMEHVNSITDDFDIINKIVKDEKNKPMFRGKPVSPVAASWHYGYIKSVSKFLNDKMINEIDSLIFIAKQASDEAYTKKTTETVSKACMAAIKLYDYLRGCHLFYTAPITASFGTNYNIKDNEYSNILKLDNEFSSEDAIPLDDMMLDIIRRESGKRLFLVECENKVFTKDQVAEMKWTLDSDLMKEMYKYKMKIKNEISKEGSGRDKVGKLYDNYIAASHEVFRERLSSSVLAQISSVLIFSQFSSMMDMPTILNFTASVLWAVAIFPKAKFQNYLSKEYLDQSALNPCAMVMHNIVSDLNKDTGLLRLAAKTSGSGLFAVLEKDKRGYYNM